MPFSSTVGATRNSRAAPISEPIFQTVWLRPDMSVPALLSAEPNPNNLPAAALAQAGRTTPAQFRRHDLIPLAHSLIVAGWVIQHLDLRNHRREAFSAQRHIALESLLLHDLGAWGPQSVLELMDRDFDHAVIAGFTAARESGKAIARCSMDRGGELRTNDVDGVLRAFNERAAVVASSSDGTPDVPGLLSVVVGRRAAQVWENVRGRA